MEMKRYKLSEIGEVRMCKRILKEETNSVGGVPFFKIGTFGGQADVFITKEKFKEYKNAYSYPKKGDILISAAGTIGRTVVFDGKDAYFQDSNIVWIENDESKVLNEYLFYCYKNIRWTTSVGSTILRLYNDDIRNTDIIVPHLSEQKKISSVLSSLDDKIALNKKINAKLEAMAKRLYDYWFVQFDFPNEEGKPYKTSGGKMVWNEVLKREIPEGWEVKSINEVCDVIDCLHSKKPNFCYEDEDSYLLSLENITKEGYIDISEKYYISKKDFSEWTSRICVKENDFLFTNAGRAGDMGMIPNGIKCAIGRNITAVRSKKINPYYLRCFFKSLYMKEQILNNLDKGCFFMSFNVRSIKQLSILIPKEENFHKFISFCEPIIKQLNKNNSEIQKLTNLRDRLLPLLMNGQVEVENI